VLGVSVLTACSTSGTLVKLVFDTYAGPLQAIQVELPKHSVLSSATIDSLGVAVAHDVSTEQNYAAIGPQISLSCTCAGACDGSFNLKLGRRLSQKFSHSSPIRIADEVVSGFSAVGPGSSLEANLNKIFQAVVVQSVSSVGSLCADSSTKTITVSLAAGVNPDFLISTYRVQGLHMSISVQKVFLGHARVGSCSDRGTCDGLTGKCGCGIGFQSSNLAMKPGASGDCGYYAGAAACPSSTDGTTCSGQGTCSGAPLFTCQCQSGYTGPACSQRLCPKGIAWFDQAIGTADQRHLVECSGRGSCSRLTGLCACDNGFEGSACAFTSCPIFEDQVCGGRGRCASVRQFAAAASVNQESVPVVSRSTAYEVQSVACSLDGTLGQNTFNLAWGNLSTADILHSATASGVEAALEALSSVDDVTVRTTSDRLGTTLAVPDTACSASENYMIITFSGSLAGNVPELSVSDAIRMRSMQLRTGTASEVQQIVCVGSTAASFTLTVGNEVTGVIPSSGAAAGGETVSRRVQRELEALASVGTVEVELLSGNLASGLEPAADFCASSPGNTLLVTFVSSVNYGKQPQVAAAAVAGAPVLTVSTLQTGAQPTYGVESPLSPGVWDANKIQGCICDTYSMGNGSRSHGYDSMRFSGPACQLSRCPFGVHPKYPYIPGIGNAAVLQTEKQGFFCEGQLTSSFFFVFRGARSEVSIPGSSTATQLKAALEGMSTIGQVDVTCAGSTMCTPSGTTCSIAFLTELGDVPSLRVMPDAPSASSLPADTYFWEELKGTGEPQECAGRGRCKADHEVGMCSCEPENVSSGGPGKIGARGDCGYQRRHRRPRY